MAVSEAHGYRELGDMITLTALVSEFVTHQAGHRIATRFGRGASAYTTPRYRRYIDDLRSQFGYTGDVLEGALKVTVLFEYPVKRGYGYRTARPDCDNLAKSVLDALQGVVYADDSQVARLEVVKVNALRGSRFIKVEVVRLP